jgi:hypothetical protein
MAGTVLSRPVSTLPYCSILCRRVFLVPVPSISLILDAFCSQTCNLHEWNEKNVFDMDMSYAKRVRIAFYSSHTSHSVSHVLHQRTASHSSYILHLTSYTLRLTSYILHLTSYILHLTSYILHLTSYILHLTSYVLRLTSYTLHLTSYSLRLTSYILNLTSYTLHLTPYVLHLTSYILHLISYRIVFCIVWHVYVLCVRHIHDPMLLP